MCNKIIQLISRFLRNVPNNESLLLSFLSSCDDIVDKLIIPYDSFSSSFWIILSWDSSILQLYSDEIKNIILKFQSHSVSSNEWNYLLIACNEKSVPKTNQSSLSASPIHSRIASSQSSFITENSHVQTPPRSSIKPFKEEKPSFFPLVILICIILLSFGGLLYLVYANPFNQASPSVKENPNYDSPVYYDKKINEEGIYNHGKESECVDDGVIEYEVGVKNNDKQSINYDYQIIQGNNQQFTHSNNNQQSTHSNNNQQSTHSNNNQQPSTDYFQSNEVSIHEEENAFIIEDEPVHISKQTPSESSQEYVDIRLLSDQSSPLFLILFLILFISIIL